jgi:protein PET117
LNDPQGSGPRLTVRTQAMHQGVVRDIEQQRIKKERQLDFDLQRELEAEYKKVQSVRDSTAERGPPGKTPPR